MSMADRVAVMAGGRVQQVAAPVELYQQPANRFVAEFIGAEQRVRGRADGRAASRLSAARVLPGTGDGAATWWCGPRSAAPDLRRAAGTVAGTVLETQFAGGMSTIVVAPDDVATAPASRCWCGSPGPTDVERGADVSLDLGRGHRRARAMSGVRRDPLADADPRSYWHDLHDVGGDRRAAHGTTPRRPGRRRRRASPGCGRPSPPSAAIPAVTWSCSRRSTSGSAPPAATAASSPTR